MNLTSIPSLFLIALCSCQSHPPVQRPVEISTPQPPAPQPAVQKKYENTDAGITFLYPSNWTPVAGSKSQLQVEAPGKDKAVSQLTLDVPKLPFHIPGMIPIDSVASGYVDDEKKRIPDQTETKLPDTTLPDAKQRRVKLSGHINGKSATDEAVLIVHNDKVYILAADGDDAGYPAAHAALDQALKTLQWTK